MMLYSYALLNLEKKEIAHSIWTLVWLPESLVVGCFVKAKGKAVSALGLDQQLLL